MRDFVRFAAAHGLSIGRAYPTDRIMRCPTQTHPHKKNGAYWWDGRRGFVQNWETGQGMQWWNDQDARPWTDQEKRAWADRQRREHAAKERRQQDAAIRAADMVRQCVPDRHEYLKYKGLPDVRGLVAPGGELVVPMRDCLTNRLLGVQVISLTENEWLKKMLPGQRAKGAVLRLGNLRSSETILCEGYATGLSIEKAVSRLNLSAAVMICFSAANLVYVAGEIGGRKLVFADNDRSLVGQKAAMETGLPYVMSDTVGNDANDDYTKFGLMAVCKKLMELREK